MDETLEKKLENNKFLRVHTKTQDFQTLNCIYEGIYQLYNPKNNDSYTFEPLKIKVPKISRCNKNSTISQVLEDSGASHRLVNIQPRSYLDALIKSGLVSLHPNLESAQNQNNSVVNNIGNYQIRTSSQQQNNNFARFPNETSVDVNTIKPENFVTENTRNPIATRPQNPTNQSSNTSNMNLTSIENIILAINGLNKAAEMIDQSAKNAFNIIEKTQKSIKNYEEFLNKKREESKNQKGNGK